MTTKALTVPDPSTAELDEPSSQTGGDPSSTTLDPALLSIARQHGMLMTTQAAQAGVSAPRLVALVKAGALRHPGRGLYAVEALVDTDPEGWHRQLCAGAFLIYPDAVLAGTSAVLAHGIPVWGVSLTSPSIRRPVKRAGGMGAFWVRPEQGESVTTGLGAASTPAAALVQHAMDRGIIPGVVSADAALREHIVSLEALSAEVESVATWPRSSRAASMLAARGRAP